MQLKKVDLSDELCILFQNINTLDGWRGHSQWRALHLTVQHEPIVFSHRSASQENCEQNPSMWPSLQTPHLQPRQEFLLHLNHDRENLMMGRGGDHRRWKMSREVVRGWGSWKSLCSLCEGAGRRTRLISGDTAPSRVLPFRTFSD